MKVHDLVENDNFLSAENLSMKSDIRINFLEVLQIRQSLPYIWRTILTLNQPFKIYNNIIFFDNKEVRLLNKSDAKKIYHFFSSKTNIKPTCILKWQSIYPNIQDTEWTNIFRNSFITSRETSIQSFQYKILHRIVACRKKLHEMKLVDNPICEVCPEVDHLQHFFFHCSYVYTFWTMLFSWFNATLNYDFTIDEKDILFGFYGIGDSIFVTHYVILNAKQYIYENRIYNNHNLSVESFKAQLKQKIEIEKNII